MIFLIVVLCTVQTALGQSYFYNTQQFGLRSTLLGGAVTSGNDDLSMAYYNPAALNLAKAEADFSLIKPHFNIFSFDDYLGEEIDKLDTDIDLSPSLASIKIKLTEKINLVLITIEKNSWNNSLTAQRNEDNGATKEEQLFKYEYTGRDRWVGAGASFPINEKLAFGVSHFFSFARYNYGYTISARTLMSATNQQINYFSEELSTSLTNNYSSTTKLGLHLCLPNHNFGLVVNTPNYLVISRNGSYERNTIDIDENISDAKNVVDFELKPTIKTPWEISFGYAFTMKTGSKLWLNVAYFTALSDYRIATIENRNGSLLNWMSGNDAVSNYAIGLSQIFGPKCEVLASFRSNLFAYKNKAPMSGEERLIMLNNDRHHISVGSNFKVGNNTILLGLDWGFTSVDNDELFRDFSNIDRLTRTPSEFKSNNISLLLTYGFLLDGFRGRRQE